jgi:hypothetical protein
VTGEGVASTFALLQSHVGLLRLDSFRVERERTVRDADGTLVRSTSVTAAVSMDRRSYRIELDRRTPDGRERRSVYATVRTENGSRDDADGGQAPVLAVEFGPNGSVRSATRLEPAVGTVLFPRAVLAENPSYRERLYRYLTVVEEATVERIDGGETATARYRITAETVRDPELLAPRGGRVSNVSVRTVATENGLLVRTVASYTVVRGDRTLRVSERIAFDVVDSPPVRPPDWYETAVGDVEASVSLVPGGNGTEGFGPGSGTSNPASVGRVGG